MMRDLSKAVAAAVVLASASAAQAQDLRQTIVGCADLECPAANTQVATTDNCTVADVGSYPLIGLTRVPTSASALQGLSWTQGFSIADDDAGRHFRRAYFLGEPPELDVAGSTDTGGCAILVHGLSEGLAFGPDGPSEAGQGTCADALGAECVSAILDRARAVAAGFTGDGRPADTFTGCARIRRDLANNTIDACLPAVRGLLTDMDAVALTGSDAEQRISPEKQSASSCWPITPKEDRLTLVAEFERVGTNQVQDTQSAAWAITPILTVFYPTGAQSLVTEIDASLSCVKIVGPSRASLPTMSSGEPESGAAGLSAPESWGLGAFAAAALALYAL
ncbi:hypothetical protein GGS23DRAFT_619541 [Durotheca rogersii]|uniref:uncharacterized protein n=1 Tax=Durotheca rogersii TaxID=419775 RepID=UPI00221FAB81|nr:uncharacterized protein GGS23DRAFT_619541 [Durotheca rogersii]KAI5864851.1 hypothetical protein GGS23DRAFT_619541 [Durotheca rogersii]